VPPAGAARLIEAVARWSRSHGFVSWRDDARVTRDASLHDAFASRAPGRALIKSSVIGAGLPNARYPPVATKFRTAAKWRDVS